MSYKKFLRIREKIDKIWKNYGKFKKKNYFLKSKIFPGEKLEYFCKVYENCERNF